jgi:hypothetical protein
MHIIE